MGFFQRFAVSALLVAGSIAFSLGLIEAGLRVIDHPRHEARILCLDAIMGNVYCPNIAERLDNMYDSTLLVTINSEGMADREYVASKPANTIRIALLGDSVAASLYTPNPEKYKSLWEAALSRRFGRPVEIMNFAIDGTGTWEQLQMFHLRARRFQPDFVVLAFYWGNDIWGNLASRDRGRANPLKDEYSVPSSVMSVRVAHRKQIRWLWNNSAAYQFLDTLKEKIETMLAVKRALPAAAPATGVANVAAAAINDPALAWDSEAWQLTRQLILKLKSETDQAGASLLLFHLPTLDQVESKQNLPVATFREFLLQSNIGQADAFEPLSKLTSAQRTALYIGDRWHLTGEGHRFFATESLPALEAFIERRTAAQ